MSKTFPTLGSASSLPSLFPQLLSSPPALSAPPTIQGWSCKTHEVPHRLPGNVPLALRAQSLSCCCYPCTELIPQRLTPCPRSFVSGGVKATASLHLQDKSLANDGNICWWSWNGVGAAGTGLQCSLFKKTTFCGLFFFDSPALMMFLSHPGSLGASKLRAEAPGSSCCQRGEACLEVGLWVGSNTFPGLPPLSGGWLWSQGDHGALGHLQGCTLQRLVWALPGQKLPVADM